MQKEEIEPASELVNESRPGPYKKVKNYPETLFHHYQQGKRPIDALKTAGRRSPCHSSEDVMNTILFRSIESVVRLKFLRHLGDTL